MKRDYKRYWDEERETMPPQRRRALILSRIREQIEYAYERIPFYRELYDRQGLKPADIRSLDDFSEKVPVVTKEMLREAQERHPPFGNFGLVTSEIYRINGTSGTTGKPTLFAISRDDWEHIAEAQAMQLWAAGVRPDDTVQISFPLSLFLGGWGMLGAAEKIGARVLTIGGGDTERQLELMYQVGSSVLCATPSFSFYLLEAARQRGKEPRDSPLRIGILGGEPGAGIPEVKNVIEEGWGIRAIDFGNCAEAHPCSNMECDARTGMHVYLDVNYTQVVERDDPHSTVPMGQRGAVVYTHLWRRSQPVIRYWAGDETMMTAEPCPCGRTYPRLPHGILGRLDDMLIIRGVNVYPSVVEQALRDTPGVGIEFRVFLEKRGMFEEARIEAECDADWYAKDRTKEVQAGAEQRVKALTGVRIPVKLVRAGTFPRAHLKSRRVIRAGQNEVAAISEPESGAS